MSTVLVATIGAVVVLRVTGFKWNWPWRIADLELEASDRPAHRPHRTSGRVGAGRSVGNRTIRRRDRHRSSRILQLGRRSGTSTGEVLRSLPFTADLLLVATSAGHSIHTAVEAVCSIDDGPVGRMLSEAWSGFLMGAGLSDELRRLPGIHGEEVRSLVDTLVMGLSSGAPLEPALHRLADRQRQRIRRRTERRVRRLPILLLGPLVVFVLPSFVLLTIVPVVLVTARGIGK